MTENHPITPPPELVQQWARESARAYEGDETWIDLATQAARWGADQELEACCEWVSQWRCMVGGNRPEVGLRAARRPKSPSLAEEALKALQDQIDTSFKISSEAQERANTIRAALNRLKELEQSND